ncbi:MAG: SRPBCC domain-containing protein [Pyrinomonadaceae bacterium]|nr:SRPBCC domain-containing protein [Pyrinomonadaceae bacterium]
MPEDVIKLERIIRAPIADVFDHLVEAERLERWFGTDCEFDADKRSFSYWFISTERDDLDHRAFGTILRLEPYDRLMLEWSDGVFESTVEFLLKKVTNQCTFLSILHNNWTESAAYARMKQQNDWDFYLDNLRRVVEGHGDLRQNFYAQVVRRKSFIPSDDHKN